MQLHVQRRTETSEEVRYKLCAAVRRYVPRNTMFGEDVEDEEFGEKSGSDGVVRWDEYALFS